MSLSAGTVSQTANESRLYTVDFTTLLGSSETISSATVTGSPAGLTIGTPTVNDSAVTVDGVSIATGKAVQVRISGVTANTDYIATARVVTSASNTIEGWFKVSGIVAS